MVDPGLVAMGTEAPLGVVALLPDVFVDVKRDHGASFDRLVRQARELRGDDGTASEAAQLAPISTGPQIGGFGATKTGAPGPKENALGRRKKRGEAREPNPG